MDRWSRTVTFTRCEETHVTNLLLLCQHLAVWFSFQQAGVRPPQPPAVVPGRARALVAGIAKPSLASVLGQIGFFQAEKVIAGILSNQRAVDPEGLLIFCFASQEE